MSITSTESSTAGEGEPATQASERPGMMFVEQRAGERPFGAFVAQYVIGGRRQARAPLGVAELAPRRGDVGVGAGQSRASDREDGGADQHRTARRTGNLLGHGV